MKLSNMELHDTTMVYTDGFGPHDRRVNELELAIYSDCTARTGLKSAIFFHDCRALNINRR